MNKVIFSVLILLTTTCIAAQHRNDTVSWLNEAAFDFETTDPTTPITGIPFASMLKEVDLVLAGEATHGTKEFAQAKHRLFRYLVQNMGFRYFLVEADFAAALLVDSYICKGDGDPVEALKAVRYFHIANQEGLDMVKWMREFNSTRQADDQIRFFGFDCQASDNALKLLKKYFSDVDPQFFNAVDTLELTRMVSPRSIWEEKYPTLTLENSSIERLRNHLIANQGAFTERSSEPEYRVALRLTEILRQSNEIVINRFSYRLRENYMAENVRWLLDEFDPGPEKAFLWAHNAHVRYGEVFESGNPEPFGTLGKTLKEKYTDKVYCIGFDFNKGSFVANKIGADSIFKSTFSVEDAPPNTFSSLLSETGKEVLFIDFASLADANTMAWLRNNRVKLQSNIGGIFHRDSRWLRYKLTESLDGLIFVNTSNPVGLDFDDR